MGIRPSKYLWALAAAALPEVAHAQHISPLIAGLALSPILILLLAVVLGIVTRSWRIGAKHAGLVMVWIVLFGIASYWVENDYIIWTPLALYAIHAVIMLLLVVRSAIQRFAR